MICETMAGDNRFEIIAKAKHAILEGTNIETSEDEMKVLDNILFRCWQMGWLDKYGNQQPDGDLISRQDAIDAVNSLTYPSSLMDVKRKLIELPSAEPKTGKWKIDEYGIYHCPICHAINNTVYKSFCPNCGARMNGGEEE